MKKKIFFCSTYQELVLDEDEKSVSEGHCYPGHNTIGIGKNEKIKQKLSISHKKKVVTA